MDAATESNGRMAALGERRLGVLQDRCELGGRLKAGGGVGEASTVGVQCFEVAEGEQDRGVSVPGEEIERGEAGNPGECGEVKSLLNKEL